MTSSPSSQEDRRILTEKESLATMAESSSSGQKMISSDIPRRAKQGSRHRRDSKSDSQVNPATDVPEYTEAKMQLASMPAPQSLEEVRQGRRDEKAKAKEVRERSIGIIRRATEARVRTPLFEALELFS